MTTPRIEAALASARETKAALVGNNVLAQTPALFERMFPGCEPLIVADLNTFEVAGKQVLDAFRKKASHPQSPYIFEDPDLYAEHRFVERLEELFGQTTCIPVAVGSGTINDLCKLASHRTGRGYMSVATAASMDGYTAFGASITYKGSKQTFNCPAPVAVVADLEVIRNAPLIMNAAGYTDLMAKVTAGADWIVADALGIEPIDQTGWQLVQEPLLEWLADPQKIREREPQAIQRLMEGLLLGGFAMQWTKTSRVASGAEHQFSHLWDMQHHTHNGMAPSHGFKVGIGTQASTALYEAVDEIGLEGVDVEACCAAWPDRAAAEAQARSLFDFAELADKAAEEMNAKWISADKLRDELTRLKQVWPELRLAVKKQLMPLKELQERQRAVGAPVRPEDIGISPRRLRESFPQAYSIRRRYTIFDLAVRARLLDPALSKVFSRAGEWRIEDEAADFQVQAAHAD